MSIMRIENPDASWEGEWGTKVKKGARREKAEGGDPRRDGGKGGAKKRPSVETEGRLTIACHMKNLRKICVVFVLQPAPPVTTIPVAPTNVRTQ